jgi:hypothetical protein
MLRQRLRSSQQHLSPLRRGGFNRIELIIAVLLGLVVVGLLATFIPRAREKANRLACANNLRQMGEAIRMFRDGTKPPSLPASCLAPDYATWAVEIAPYLACQTGVLPHWDLRLSYFEQPEEVRQAQVLVYYCPSRRAPPQNSDSGDVPAGSTTNVVGALGDYACAAGTGDPRRPWTSAKADGAIIPAEVTRWGPKHTIRTWRGRTDFAVENPQSKSPLIRVRRAADKAEPLGDELKRGTSQTILLGEKHGRPEDFGRAEHGDGSVYNGGRPASYARVGGPGHGLARSIYEDLDLRYPIFGSYHPDICQFLMADGSVRDLATDVDETYLGQLIARDGES